MSQRIGILSLGCPRNLVESESLLGRLKRKGYAITDIAQADTAIVNTCAFIEDAKRESIDAILNLAQLKKQGSLKRLVVCGCLSERYKDKLRRELPEVDAFLGKPSLNHGLDRFALTPRHFAYLKICEGCIHQCSYCAIPQISPKFTSLEMEAVLRRVEFLDRDRISELNIVGQDITGYGIDLYKRRQLPELLKKICRRAKHIRWIRLLYLYPENIVDELLQVISVEEKVCKYIDLPVQHINSRILKLMRRSSGKKEIIRLIEKIRRIIPGAAIRTSVIVGFPSETDKEFKELLDFISEVKFDRLGAFIYSREERTPAYNFKGQVPRSVKEERFNALMLRQQQISGELNAKFLGKTLEVLIDEKEKGNYLGRSYCDAPEVDGLVYVKSKDKLKPGDFVKVKITDTLEYDLVGETR